MENNKLFLTFGISYSSVIGFLLYGPLMGVLLGHQAYVYTIVSLVAFIIAFLNPRIQDLSKEMVLGALGISFCLMAFTVTFTSDRSLLIAFSLILFAFWIATICRCFTLQVVQEQDVGNSERVIASSFFIAFFILYGLNILTPILSFLSAMGIITAITLMITYSFKKEIKLEYSKANLEIRTVKQVILPLLALYLIYIGGGVSYVAIYPNLIEFEFIDRFYNVLPLLLALPITVIVAKRFGYMANLLLGILALSIAFAFFLLPISLFNYFITQTFLQLGWGFMNVFGFSYSWRLAYKQNQPHIFAYGILFILMGVFSGSLIAYYIIRVGLAIQYHGLITFVPIVISLLVFFFYHDRQKEMALIEAKESGKKIIRSDGLEASMFHELELLSALTRREKEVMYLYYHSETAAQIAEILHISQNTVRSHIKNAYAKLEINKRDDLKKMINQVIE